MSDSCTLVAVRSLYEPPPKTLSPKSGVANTSLVFSTSICDLNSVGTSDDCSDILSPATALPPQVPARRHRLQQRASRRRGVMLRASSIPRVSDSPNVGLAQTYEHNVSQIVTH
ncbi:hypothetical protein O3M35_002446 [Rhynocoris fuscipes]|uniref:Uncharacterized protein n=1 Tax=Rhynocoris fuscipes TaxID=488301 RepID=A0AAW1CM49_9HEMI